MCHSHCSFRPLLISNIPSNGVLLVKGGSIESVDSLMNLAVELVESIVHSFNLSWYSVINSLSTERPVVGSKNLDIEVD